MATRSVKQLALKVEKARQQARPERKEEPNPKAEPKKAQPKGPPCPKCEAHPGKFIFDHTGEIGKCYACNGTGFLAPRRQPTKRRKRKTRMHHHGGAWWSRFLPIILLILGCAAATNIDVPDWWGFAGLPR